MNSTEAKQGFITFVITLVVASGVFAALYLAVNKLNTKAEVEVAVSDQTVVSAPTPAPRETAKEEKQKENVFAALVKPETPTEGSAKDDVKKEEVKGDTTTLATDTPKQETKQELKKLPEKSSKVLGAADNAPQTTPGAVPTTGTGSFTSLILISAIFIIYGTYFGLKRARPLAIRNFERRITKGL
ncbi:hypothetical protein A2716_05060 [candidate division WWE3 bacterium RIFCSPHIGHO2_01_FULL_40_23]|uniref:Uncharacterized protein n=1 Tax=candidate division WWE3 bacterium RIFCSPLOWO2_01_FULL_41_18 TaxID=1802625 RepID=A0A1F4VE75_UNCKA|nr:MAG: hypothetical protein A2716_05060 [candidate division WWE3 bacterium RIFCSPHIGHO2_01_FULL_40_23]OGC55240.1 MAG: hypothetical protein A3A78_04670 [candidate division WWE3 bacterium RIFCSPLOWO2_01_FULL_41_18]